MASQALRPLEPFQVPLSGTTLIEASAGTGKTYTITTLVLRMLLERELEIAQILVVTFTRAATAELRDRVRRRIAEMIDAIDVVAREADRGAAESDVDAGRDVSLLEFAHARVASAIDDRLRLVRALRDFDQAPILTIHAFCQRTLGEEALESQTPFDLSFLEDESQLVELVAQDFWGRKAYPGRPELVAHMRAQGAQTEALEALATQVVRDPEMAIVPDVVEVPAPIDPAPFLEARDQAAALWSASRAELLRLLDPSVALHKSSYKPDVIAHQWAPQLDALGAWTHVPSFGVRLTQEGLAEKTRKGCHTPQHPFFEAMSRLVRLDAARTQALDQQVLAIKRELVDYARTQVLARKRAGSTQSFGDLLTALHRALGRTGGEQLAARIRERYRAALIDEFQDTDPVQYAIFARVFGEGALPLFQIGDPKQAIYAFRGADIFTYMEAARSAHGQVHTLDRSYRSDPRLLHAINTLFAARRPFLYEDIRYVDMEPRQGARERLAPGDDPDGDTAALQLLFVRRSEDNKPGRGNHIRADWAHTELATRVATEVVTLLESGATIAETPIAPRHIAVLCRTNKQAEATQRALMALQVPTVREGDNSVFDTETAEELERLLGAALEPADARKAQAALASALLGASGATLYAMRQGEGAQGELELWMERFAAWGRLWHERGFVHAFHRLVDDADVQQRLLERPDGQRRLTDLLHLGELLHSAASTEHLGPLSLLVWLSHMRQDREARGALVGESAQVRLEHDDHAVMLTTIHRSKGLEYPVVFCPYLFAPPIVDRGAVRFHDGADGHRLKLDIGSDELELHKLQARREASAEALRLLYVALTRAKHRCYVVWGRFHQSGLSALAHLLHQGDVPDDALADGLEERLRELTDDAMLAELALLCRASDDAIGVRELSSLPPSAYTRPLSARADLAPREARRRLPAWLRSASFSRIVAERTGGVSAPAEEGLDHDEAPVTPVIPAVATPDAAETPRVLLHDFPAGARAGSCIHSVLEHIEFQETDAAALREPCEYWLSRYGLASGERLTALASTLASGIDQMLHTALPGADGPLTLADVPRAERLDELEFLLPAGSDAAPFDSQVLAEIFARHAGPGADAGQGVAFTDDYLARLSALEFSGLSGHLRGFIDLIFRHRGRFYVVDYKSNWLGEHAGHYSREAMQRSMAEHHYYLQYHLYTVALHRYLGARLDDYDYERDCGGAFYLFIRGMAPHHPAGSGVFHDRPSAALIDALSAALGAPAAPYNPAAGQGADRMRP